MPFVSIRIVKEVLAENAREKKAEISRRVTDAINHVTGLPKEVIWVVFEDVPAAEWYVGAKSAEQIREESERQSVAAGAGGAAAPVPEDPQ